MFMDNTRTSSKGFELLGTLGVLLLGIGLGAWFSSALNAFIFPMLIIGGICHAVAMLATHRVETMTGIPQPRWVQMLYWLCWLLLIVMAALAIAQSMGKIP